MAKSDVVFLKAHGVHMTPEALSAEVEAAVRSRLARLSASPREEFSASDIEALEAGGLDLSPIQDDEVLQADRTVADYAALIATSLSTSSAAEILGCNTSRIRQRIQAKTLYAFRVDGEWLIPRFQFRNDAPLPGLGRVVRNLRAGLHPLKVESWFLAPNPDLTYANEDRQISPRDWLLRGGEPDVAADLASHL